MTPRVETPKTGLRLTISTARRRTVGDIAGRIVPESVVRLVAFVSGFEQVVRYGDREPLAHTDARERAPENTTDGSQVHR